MFEFLVKATDTENRANKWTTWLGQNNFGSRRR